MILIDYIKIGSGFPGNWQSRTDGRIASRNKETGNKHVQLNTAKLASVYASVLALLYYNFTDNIHIGDIFLGQHEYKTVNVM